MPRNIKLNINGLREVLKSPAMQGVLREHAERIADQARATAPVDTGEYRNSIRAESRVHSRVAVGRVVATAPHALVVEARTGNLARAL